MSRPGEARDPVALAAASSFVFTGVVGSVSKNSPGVGTTMRLRVEAVHDAPELLVDFEGQLVDVVVSDEDVLAAGDRRVFFTNPMEFGSDLLLASVGSLEVGADPDALGETLVRVRDQHREQAVALRIEGSVAVLHGVVFRLDRVRTDAYAVSEHDPQWWIARIEVIEFIKGDAKDVVSVRFANSRDVAWNAAPKLHPDQEAILLIQDDPREGVEERLAVIAEDDVRAPDSSELALVRRLVG